MLARPIFRDRKSVRRLAPCLVYFKIVCPSMGSVLGWRISVSPRLSFQVVFTMGCLLWALPSPMGAETPQPAQEPEAAWLFPLGGQRGTALEVEIRGKALQSAYAVVAEEEGIRTQLRAVEEIVEESEEGPREKADKKEPEYRVRVGVEIDPEARPLVPAARGTTGSGWSRPGE